VASNSTKRTNSDHHAIDYRQNTDAKVIKERTASVWIEPESCSLADFRLLVEEPFTEQYPHSEGTELGAVIYDGPTITKHLTNETSRRLLQAEWVHILDQGPGLVVFRNAINDDDVERVSTSFNAMIDEQHQSGNQVGDHFAKPGSNDRVWNALEKLALRDPEAFVAYYGNAAIAAVSEAWLGPCYQMTSQVNVVNPGGIAQSPHRDYHLGFLSDGFAAQFPQHVHRMSPQLTLQGAVAHCDMPVETGPTLYLPHSQKYVPGYLAWRRPEFREYFDQHYVQLALQKGDAVFFNPALFHAAGTNRTTTVRRMANLLQVSSAFGRAMERVDRSAMSIALYPALLTAKHAGIESHVLRNAVAACAEGYAFPTNLDRDPPINGLAPFTQADLLNQAIGETWPLGHFTSAIREHANRRNT
jgi:ectoine hydroxylase-related dioxygenase (phytanoyl-CoA dioxygenase family)